MPTYNAKCKDCFHLFTFSAPIRAMDDVPPCPICGKPAERVYTAPEGGFILRGGGWFKAGGFGAKGWKKEEK